MELNRKFRKLLNAQLRGMTVSDIMEPEVVTINEDAEDRNSIRVKERMSTRLVCVSPGDGVTEAMEKMKEEGIGRLVVMEDDTLVGIVSRSSIMDGAIKRLLF